MTVAELIKALVDYDPSSQIRIKPSVSANTVISDPGVAITGLSSIDPTPVRQRQVVLIEQELPY